MNGGDGCVTLELHGALRYEAGARDVSLPSDVGTLRAALLRLVEDCGERASRMLFDRDGKVWRSVVLLVNGEPVKHGLETELNEGDTVSILLPLAGG